MKKLLCLLSLASSCAFANFLPSGHYAGELHTHRGSIDPVDPKQTSITNDQAHIVIPVLHDIGSKDGLLSGNIVNINAGLNIDCTGGSAKFSAKKGSIPIYAKSTTITNCQFDEARKTFSGTYTAELGIPTIGHQTGSFRLTLQ